LAAVAKIVWRVLTLAAEKPSSVEARSEAAPVPVITH